MKTELVIDDDLKEYLIRTHDRTNDEYNVKLCKKLDMDSFNIQYIFEFENNYGASVIKHFRFLWF